MAAGDAGRVLASGHDFYSSPRLSPDGRWLACLAWDHPNMPWDRHDAVRRTRRDGSLRRAGASPAAPAESIFQPEWSPDGSALYFVSDRTGWWNLYRYDVAHRRHRAARADATPSSASRSGCFGMSTYAFAGPDRIVCSYIAERRSAGSPLIDLATRRADAASTCRTPISPTCAPTATAWCSAAARPRPPRQHRATRSRDGQHRGPARRRPTSPTIRDLARYFTPRRADRIPDREGRTAYGLYYPPFNPDYAAPAGETPPLLVKCHGGPTAAASSALDLRIQYWTSRGIAVLDVNYGGSTGYGRAYRERLQRHTGASWTSTIASTARASWRAQAWSTRARCVITGGSAGGYTTLAALTFRDDFRGGASHYGVSDLAALAQRHAQVRVALPRLADRPVSGGGGALPRALADPPRRRLSLPGHLLPGRRGQGRAAEPDRDDGRCAARARALPVGYLLFAGEQHGFRQAANIKRALDAELYFYAFKVFGTRLSF